MACWIVRSKRVGIPNIRVPPVWLGYIHASNGSGNVGAVFEFLSDLLPVNSQKVRKLLIGYPVYAGSSFVLDNLLRRIVEIETY